MTKAGKVLVIVNVIFAIFFLSMSLLAYSTRLDLSEKDKKVKEEQKAQRDLIGERTKVLAGDNTKPTDGYRKDLEKLKKENENLRADLEKNQKAYEAKHEQARADIRDTRKKADDKYEETIVSTTKQQKLRTTVEQKRAEKAELDAKYDAKAKQKTDLLNKLAQKLNEADNAKQLNDGLEQRLKDLDGQ